MTCSCAAHRYGGHHADWCAFITGELDGQAASSAAQSEGGSAQATRAQVWNSPSQPDRAETKGGGAADKPANATGRRGEEEGMNYRERLRQSLDVHATKGDVIGVGLILIAFVLILRVLPHG